MFGISHCDQVKMPFFIGKTFTSIDGMKPSSDHVTFITSDGVTFHMYHEQDCCEHVALDDVIGDVGDILNTPIVDAYEASNSDGSGKSGNADESFTWTFYRFITAKGSVTLRWYGTSNGYYSERVGIYTEPPLDDGKEE